MMISKLNLIPVHYEARSTMPILVARLLALWALTYWVGGFTFYSAVVIPLLHEELGSSLETGLVTRRVTDVLNLLGIATITLGWIATFMERTGKLFTTNRWRSTIVALAVTTVCLIILIALHRVLDRKLDGADMHDFYPLHRLYLWVCTVQWFANMILLRCWATAGPRRGQQTEWENPQVFAGPSKPKNPS
jgi:hypothetical protein